MEGTSSGTHGAVSTRELAAQITELCGHLNAANRRWLALIAEIVVRVDHSTLQHHAAGRCEIDEGPAIPLETARRLACDSSVINVVEDEAGEPLDVGRRTRSIPPALRRALNARDRGCHFPGCTHTRYVDGHHVHHWADGGAWRFGKPGGDSFVSAAPGRTWPLDVRSPTDVSGCDGTELAAAHRGLGVAIDATTAATRWRGERMDHVWVMDVLMQRWERSRGNVAAATAGMNP